MTPELYQQIIAHGAAVNLSAHAKFRLTGADRTRYLNGQVTNDVRRAKADATLHACVTDAKGRIAADIRLHVHADTLLLDSEPDLRDPLGMRLERYIVADDVELTDVSEEWQLWHVWGGTEAPVLDGNLLCGQESVQHSLQTNRYGVPGFDLWLPAGAAAPDFGTRPVLSAQDLESWRILQHIPRWPHELNAETFPPEAGLEGTAMDFAKGCYIGQEVLSRIKTTGKMPRELISFESATAVHAGDELWLEKAIGAVTSVTQHPVTGRSVGLAMIRQGTAKESLHIGSSSGALLVGG